MVSGKSFDFWRNVIGNKNKISAEVLWLVVSLHIGTFLVKAHVFIHGAVIFGVKVVRCQVSEVLALSCFINKSGFVEGSLS